MQSVCPDGHTQAPLEQLVPPLHFVLQAPQLDESAFRSTHLPAQSVWVLVQFETHFPLLQVCAPSHWVPQVPQWSLLV